MGLDKTCNNVFYLTGRYIAIVERSNGKKLTGSQVDNLFSYPSMYMDRYDFHRGNLCDEREEILSKLPAEGFPKRTSSEQSGRMWIGYHHQHASLHEIIVEHHEPKKVECSSVDNTIEELHK